jgi:hypothetical protein
MAIPATFDRVAYDERFGAPSGIDLETFVEGWANAILFSARGQRLHYWRRAGEPELIRNGWGDMHPMYPIRSECGVLTFPYRCVPLFAPDPDTQKCKLCQRKRGNKP